MRLKRPTTATKKRRIGEGRNQRLAAERPDQMWALGLQTDATTDGRQVRFLTIVDQFTREALASRPFRSCISDQLCVILDEIIELARGFRTPDPRRMSASQRQSWMPAARPPEFRRRAVECARLREKPIAEMARNLGISQSRLRRRMYQADVYEGHKSGLTTDE